MMLVILLPFGTVVDVGSIDSFLLGGTVGD